jgi:hypothetical protein
VERKIVGKIFGKREMWKRNSERKFWKKRKQMRETIKKKLNSSFKTAAICNIFFFFVNLIKYLFYLLIYLFIFCFSNTRGILQI